MSVLWDRRAVVGLLPALAAAPASAQSRRSTRAVDAIIRSLAPIHPRSTPAGTGLRSVETRGTVIVVDDAYSIDLDVFFDFDSDHITPRARRDLAPLGLALRSPQLASERYLLAGHTDARGPADYNEDLSFRRAAAVKQHLVTAHDLHPARFEIWGYGFGRLRNPAAPRSGVNRRVEVTLIPAARPEALPQASETPAPAVSTAPAEPVPRVPPPSAIDAIIRE